MTSSAKRSFSIYIYIYIYVWGFQGCRPPPDGMGPQGCSPPPDGMGPQGQPPVVSKTLKNKGSERLEAQKH